MAVEKLGVIVPYRDRYEHLLKFKMLIQAKLHEAKIPYELIVVEQDDSQSFNRGKLLNIGFQEAERLGCDYVVFHDVDMVPKKVDYSYADYPIHLATSDIPFEEYFGGITMFPMEDFKKINGFSNRYWGWGFEDDDLLHRCKIKGIKLAELPVSDAGPNTAALRFNGVSSHVKIPNRIRTRGDFTIHISLEPTGYSLDSKKREDKYVAFGIPGYDFNIMYTSFRRFAVEFFDGKKNHHFIYSNIVPNVKTTLTFVYNRKEGIATLYQGAKRIGEKELEFPIRLYDKEISAYLGCSDPDRKEDNNFFKGVINTYAIWNKALSYEEIVSIQNNKYFGLADNFDSYNSAGDLVSYGDAKFIKEYKLMDIARLSEHSQIVDCEVVKYDLPKHRVLKVPHRRTSDYKTLDHEDNGFLTTGWKDITTRYNQLKFMNEVMYGSTTLEEDGLSTLKFKILSNSNVRNITQLTVKL